MELKQLIFLGMTVTFIPVAAWFGIRYRWAERMLVAGALFSTCYLIDINFVSMEWYRGDTKGFEFGVTDWMIISLIIVMAKAPRWRKKRPEPLPPNATLMLAYFFLAVLSIFVAYVPVYAGFGVFKILRAMAVYWVAYNYLRSEEDLRFFLMVLAGMVALQFLLVLQDRMNGIYRAKGSTPHSNTLAMYINMMNMIFLSFVLGDANAGRRRYIYWGALGMGTVIVLATFSRGALAMMVMGYGLVTLLSTWDRPRTHKFKTVGLMFLAALPLIIKVAPAIIERFETAPEAAEASRHQANDAAYAMAKDTFFGVGLNNYSHVINETGYARFIPLESDRGIVHNVFWLHASEMGWAGLVVFLLMIGNFFLMGLRYLLRRKDDITSWMAIGIFAGMTTLWVQSLLEWAFRQTYLTVEFFLMAGFLAALPRLERSMRRERRNRKLRLAWLAHTMAQARQAR
jgi:cell division protein FtsW (lipid II flippase)